MNDPLPQPAPEPIAAPFEAFLSPPAAPDPRRATRGRFLPRWNARVIEQDDLIVVEFVDQPWYTEATRRQHRQRSLWSLALRLLHLI